MDSTESVSINGREDKEDAPFAEKISSKFREIENPCELELIHSSSLSFSLSCLELKIVKTRKIIKRKSNPFKEMF